MNAPKPAQPSVPRLLLIPAMFALLTGCASVNFEQTLANTNQAAGLGKDDLALVQQPQERAKRQAASSALLEKPVQQADAVRLALLQSPALQAMLAQHWGEMAMAAQTGRIANPLLNFERIRSADELELGRLLSFGLLDLLSLPQRQQLAQAKLAQQQLQLSMQVIRQVAQVRQAWVNAVAAQQNLQYAQQVQTSAQASAELARRMQAAGNFSKLERTRHQTYYAQATTQLALAQHASLAAREELIRQLGLDSTQASKLQLPARLPDLPSAPRSTESVLQAASNSRLDIQLAQAQLKAAAKAQGLSNISSLIDIELGVRRDTAFDHAGVASSKRGFELDLRLPLFDAGDLQRAAMNAQTLAAANRLQASVQQASSHLRENYSAYRTAFEIARHYRDEILPLKKATSEEKQLRYNGMLIGVFELLADSREQIASVQEAIAAERQFWLQDAALQAAMLGTTPDGMKMLPAASMGSGGDAPASH